MPYAQPGLTGQILRSNETVAPQLSGRGPVLRWRNGLMLATMLAGAALLTQWLVQAMPSAHAQSRVPEPRDPVSAQGTVELDQPGLRDDATRELATLMSQASQYQPAQVRQSALDRLQAVPELSRALAAVLQGPQRDQALAYLESNDPVDARALAEPVRAAIVGLAADLRDEIRRTPTLRGDHFVPQVRRILAAADKFEPYGVDYLPGVRAVREALAEPHPQGGDLRCRQVLERWLAKHARSATRPAQRLSPGLA